MIHILLISFSALIIAQIIKLIIDALNKNFSWKDLNSYGGFPSSHSAFTVSLTAAIAYFEGWQSVAFAISLVFTLIIIRDAVGLRMQIGKQAATINKLIHLLPSNQRDKFSHQKERLGHTNLEIFGGVLTGLLVTWIYIQLFI